jgi:hypothetical protein
LLQIFSQFAASSVLIVWPNTGYRAVGQIRDPRPRWRRRRCGGAGSVPAASPAQRARLHWDRIVAHLPQGLSRQSSASSTRRSELISGHWRCCAVCGFHCVEGPGPVRAGIRPRPGRADTACFRPRLVAPALPAGRKQRSVIVAAISAPSPAKVGASCTTMAGPVCQRSALGWLSATPLGRKPGVIRRSGQILPVVR